MKIANSIKLTVFAKEEEDEEKIKQSLLSLIPFDIEKEQIELKKSVATGFSEKRISILEISLEKDRHVAAFIKSLNARLSNETKKRILSQAENRLDNELNFFLRFAKDKLINENELYLTDQGNCFHVKISIAAFPRKRENALEIIRNFFKVGE